MEWTHYVNKTITEHLLLIVSLSRSGYRPQSISLHGTTEDPNAPIYFSAIWVKRSGPAFKILPLGTQYEAEQFIKDNQNPPEGTRIGPG